MADLLPKIRSEDAFEAPARKFELREKETTLRSTSGLPFVAAAFLVLLRAIFGREEDAMPGPGPAEVEGPPGPRQTAARGGEDARTGEGHHPAQPESDGSGGEGDGGGQDALLSSGSPLVVPSGTGFVAAPVGMPPTIHPLSGGATLLSFPGGQPIGAVDPAPLPGGGGTGGGGQGGSGGSGEGDGGSQPVPGAGPDNVAGGDDETASNGDNAGGSGGNDGPGGEGGGSGDNGGSTGGGGGNTGQRNRAPVVTASVVLPAGLMNQQLVIALDALLRGASDPDGDQLNVFGLTASSGTLVQVAPGRWLYTPARDATGPVTFSYKITDGQGFVNQTASTVIEPVDGKDISGTEGDDVLIGTAYADRFDAGDGDDVVVAREGDDVIFGGAGNDRLLGGDGDDVIYAGAGHDVAFGGSGHDKIFGEAGDDVLFGEAGTDQLFGGSGNDRLSGGEGRDVLVGEAGDDHLEGDGGDDILDGGEGHDLLDGGAGSDLALGGAGNDVLVAQDGDGDDHYVGGEGIDTLDQSAVTGRVVVDLEARSAGGTTIGQDVVEGVENVKSGSGDDVLAGDAGANVMEGGAGDDIFVGRDGDGDDRYVGGSGSDTIDLSAVTAAVVIDLAAGTVTGTTIGADLVQAIENAIGGAGDDRLIGDAGSNRLDGGFGDDTFVGVDGDGDDHYVGGSGTDTLDLSRVTTAVVIDLAAQTAVGIGIGSDVVEGIECVIAGSGDDRLVADGAANVFTSGAGNDIFVFGSLGSLTNGGKGSDRICDFAVGDRIDLSALNAQQLAAGLAALKIVSEDLRGIEGGQIVIERIKFDDRGGRTEVKGYLSGPDHHDFKIELDGYHDLKESDFILVVNSAS